MCGIFGFITSDKAGLNKKSAGTLLNDLFRLSESRGKEASGAAFFLPNKIRVIKKSIPASELIRLDEYKKCISDVLDHIGKPLVDSENIQVTGIMGHSRLVTNGSQKIHSNNQPVITSGMVGIHNGIITNVDELWMHHPDLERKYDIDTEILLSLIRKNLDQNCDLAAATRNAYAQIEGAASIAVFFEDFDCLLLATNNGSLYHCSSSSEKFHVFASENYILRTIADSKNLRSLIESKSVTHVEPGTGLLIDLKTLRTNKFSLGTHSSDSKINIAQLQNCRPIVDISVSDNKESSTQRFPGEGPYILSHSFIDEYSTNHIAINKLKRCTCCILPETMPFIKFDENGVCNYCKNYKKIEVKGIDVLLKAVEPFRKKNGEPDCLVTLSGGRDSSFGVHFVKKVLEMNPVTYTYDWGMVTDLARRNQMRICGKLGVEHILVSADIAQKRNNIRKNVLAWLQKPDLGTIPLFMAGDKQYFYHANRVGEQTGCKMIILCENLLETTRFKSGFCGIPPFHESDHTYTLSLANKFKMAAYYGKQFLTNPAYVNSSILDTVSAFCCYYVIPHNYLNLFQYINWDEEMINSTIINGYNWETATDTKSTWRIGDGTASFYNYIYYTMAGLTENDTFRSNQIREGTLTRAQALELAEKENRPRYESMQWYCDVVGIDFENTIRTINSASKLYSNC